MVLVLVSNVCHSTVLVSVLFTDSRRRRHIRSPYGQPTTTTTKLPSYVVALLFYVFLLYAFPYICMVQSHSYIYSHIVICINFVCRDVFQSICRFEGGEKINTCPIYCGPKPSDWTITYHTNNTPPPSWL